MRHRNTLKFPSMFLPLSMSTIKNYRKCLFNSSGGSQKQLFQNGSSERNSAIFEWKKWARNTSSAQKNSCTVDAIATPVEG